MKSGARESLSFTEATVETIEQHEPLFTRTLSPVEKRTVRRLVAQNRPILSAFVQGLLNELDANRDAMQHMNDLLRAANLDDFDG